MDIKFSGGETGNTVSIEGNEANVEECKEHLLELAEEMVGFIVVICHVVSGCVVSVVLLKVVTSKNS